MPHDHARFKAYRWQAKLRVLPTVWFRNTWSWETDANRPEMKAVDEQTIELTLKKQSNLLEEYQERKNIR